MKREIKFRAYDTSDKRMYQDVMVASGGNYIGLTYNDDNDGDFEIENAVYNNTKGTAILMQFTGLLDKKGIEIYEGDVVKSKTVLGEGISQIIWDENSCCFTSKNLGSHIMDKETEFEILGNIFQNPKLLESVH